MTKYECKCCIVGRLAWDEKYPERPVFVRTFKTNNAHLTSEVPVDMPEFQNIKVIKIIGLTVDYYTEGSDIVLNNLQSIEVDKDQNDEMILVVSGKQV